MIPSIKTNKSKLNIKRPIPYGALFVLVIVGILFGFFVATNFKITILRQSAPLEMVQYDLVNEMSCESHSMGLTIPCGSIAYQQTVNSKEQIKPGQIYVYQMPNATQQVAHRLVACADHDCNMTVFKGDANKLGELIPREWIVSRVVMLQYK